MTCDIIQIQDRDSLWEDFYKVSRAVYGKDSYYCERPFQSLLAECRQHLKSYDALPLLALRKGKPVARLMAFINASLQDEQEGALGLIGFFESENRQETASLILERAMDWFRKKGISRVMGPVNGDTWHTYRFNCGPFDLPPFMMEPYNPPYYPTLWERFGFRVLNTYYSKHVPDVSVVVPQLEPLYERAIKSGIVFRPFNPSRFEEELDILYDMTRCIFSKNPYYSDIPKEAFKNLYAGAASIIDKKLFWFCVDQEGRHVGFIFSFPDYFQSLCSMKGKTHALAKLRFLLNKKKAGVLNLKTVGIDPGLRGTGLGAALMYKAYHEGLLKGYSKANLCLFHQENKSGTIDGGQGDIMRTYRLYQYPP